MRAPKTPAKTPAETPTRTMGDLHAPAHRGEKGKWQNAPPPGLSDAFADMDRSANPDTADWPNSPPPPTVHHDDTTMGDAKTDAGITPAPDQTPDADDPPMDGEDRDDVSLSDAIADPDDGNPNPGTDLVSTPKQLFAYPYADSPTAEDVANAYQLAEKTGDPVGMVKLDPEQAQHKADRLDFEQIQQKAPITAAWMAEHSDNKVLGQSDLENLIETENAFQKVIDLLPGAHRPKVSAEMVKGSDRVLDKSNNATATPSPEPKYLPGDGTADRSGRSSKGKADDPAGLPGSPFVKLDKHQREQLRRSTQPAAAEEIDGVDLSVEIWEQKYGGLLNPFLFSPASPSQVLALYEGFLEFRRDFAGAGILGALRHRMMVGELYTALLIAWSEERRGRTRSKTYIDAMRLINGHLGGYRLRESARKIADFKARYPKRDIEKYKYELLHSDLYRREDASKTVTRELMFRLGSDFYKLRNNPAAIRKLIKYADKQLKNELQALIYRQHLLSQVPVHPRVLQFRRLTSQEERDAFLKKHPEVLSYMGIKGVGYAMTLAGGTVLAGLATGGVGAFTFATATGFVLANGSAVSTVLTQHGVNLKDADAIMTALKNPKIREEIERRARNEKVVVLATNVLGAAARPIVRTARNIVGGVAKAGRPAIASATKAASKAAVKSSVSGTRAPMILSANRLLGQNARASMQEYVFEVAVNMGGDTALQWMNEGKIDTATSVFNLSQSLLANGMPHAANIAVRYAKNAKRDLDAQTVPKHLQTLTRLTQNNELLKSLPQKYRDLANRYGRHQQLYLDAGALIDALSGMPLAKRAQVLKNLQVPEANLFEALKSGRFVKTTIGAYVDHLGPTKLGEKLAYHASFSKNGITATQADQSRSRFVHEIDAAILRAKEAQKLGRQRDRLFDSMMQHFKASGWQPQPATVRRLANMATQGPQGLRLDPATAYFFRKILGFKYADTQVADAPQRSALVPTTAAPTGKTSAKTKKSGANAGLPSQQREQ